MKIDSLNNLSLTLFTQSEYFVPCHAGYQLPGHCLSPNQLFYNRMKLFLKISLKLALVLSLLYIVLRRVHGISRRLIGTQRGEI